MQKNESWEKADALFSRALLIRSSAIAEARNLLEAGNQLAIETGYEAGKANYHYTSGFILETEGRYVDAVQEFLTAYNMLEACEPPYNLQTRKAATQLAKMYANLGDYSRGLKYLYKELQKSEEADDLNTKAQLHNSISIIYQRMGNQQQAELFAKQCLEIAIRVNDDRLTGISQINMGNVFGQAADWDNAIMHWELALAIFERMKDDDMCSSTLGNLGIAYKNTGQFDIAEKLLQDCLTIKKKYNNKFDIVRSKQNLAALYTDKKDFQKALELAEESITLNEQLQTRSLTYQLWLEKAKALKGLGRFADALEAYEKYHSLEKEVFTEESKKQTGRIEVQFEIDKKEKEKEIYRLRNIDLVAANEQITLQKEEIESSIRYARRIQAALLPGESVFRAAFPDSFIFYRPRDIVSGDFYWVANTGGFRFIVVADCTGHGVPGALLSVIGNNLFEQVVHKKRFTDPAKILDEISHDLQELLRSDADTVLSDGMDVAICRIDADNNLVYAGANNAAYVVRGKNATELPPDRRPVGCYTDSRKRFENRSMKLEPGDCVYLGTDGFADQFGGPKTKRFQRRQVLELLASGNVLPMSEQLERISETFQNWKGANEQTDDVCIIGVRV